MPAPILVLDIPAIDTALQPFVNSVLSDFRMGKLPVLETKDSEDEATAVVTSMLKTLIQYALEHSILLDINKAEIPFRGKPEVDCLSAKKLRVKKRLGSGMHGSVFAITATLAAKIFGMHDRTPGADDQRIAFLQEVAMGKKAHSLGVGPKIIDAYVCSAKHKEHYGIIIMTRIQGPSLDDWIKKSSAVKVLAMRLKVEALVRRMHAGGLFHNDLHSSNILVKKGSEPVFVDYEYARTDTKNSNQDMHGKARNGKTDRHQDFHVLDMIKVGAVDRRWEDREQSQHSIENLTRHVIRRAIASGLIVVHV